MFISNTLFSLLNTQLDNRFIQHILEAWTLRKLDDVIVEMVFGGTRSSHQSESPVTGIKRAGQALMT